MEKDYYWLGLSKIKGLGPIRISKLLSYFNDPRRIWEASANQLKKVDGIGKLADKIVAQRKKININRLINKLEQKNISFITLDNPQYPQQLKNIYDPPPVLFYKGENILDEASIAIVGSRKSTGYGKRIAEKLAYGLATKGIVVVSGMARGIDTHSHLGTLKAGGKTIAVLGSGLDVIYPPENRRLFKDICERGMVISEFPPGTKPEAGNFPRRNRIISGLSRGVVVVEAASRSGSLITADLALEQGRELFAVPGNINRYQSKGTNDLIKKGAKLITGVEDILEELFIYEGREKSVFPELTDEEEVILNLFKREGSLEVDQLIKLSGKSAGKVNTILLKLELKGLVSREAGKKYVFLGLQNLLKPL